MMRQFLGGLVLAFAAAIASASVGGTVNSPVLLDPGFGWTGKVLTSIGATGDKLFAMEQKPDGKLAVAGKSLNAAGNSDFTVVQYAGNGALDTSFSGDGIVQTDFGGSDEARTLAVQPDGKLVAGGFTSTATNPGDFALARYLTNGSLDASFGTGGMVTTNFVGLDQVLDLAIQPDGKIVAAGQSVAPATGANFALARYNANGTLDPTFGVGGRVTTDFFGRDDVITSISIQPDGKILAAGSAFNTANNTVDFAIARYNSNGGLDSTFATFGAVGIGTTDFAGSHDIAYSLLLLPDGRFLVGGVAASGSNYDAALARYNANGTLDTTFSPGGAAGLVTLDFFGDYDQILAMQLQPDGKILAGGYAKHPQRNFEFALMRFTAEGEPDNGFGLAARYTADWFGGADGIHSMALQAGGSVVAAGSAFFPNTGGDDFALARYLVADPDWTAGVVTSLPPGDFLSPAARTSLLTELDGVDTDLAAGSVLSALDRLRALRLRMNGCGVAPDADDWLVTCTAQGKVRIPIEQMIYKYGIAAGDTQVLAVGDIASCDSTGDEAVSALLDNLMGPIITLGDTVYDSGTAEEFANCWVPSWGRHKDRIRPAIGNHEYLTPNAAPYFAYFGAAAGDPDKGYYSYDIASWHVVTLNSNCGVVPGGCDIGSPQYEWLKADLAANPSACVLAAYHHPTLSAGPQPSNQGNMMPLWRLLYDNRVDLALVGHDHNYQRYGPLNRESNAAAPGGAGIRQILVGTGGQGNANLSPTRAAATPGLEVWADYAFDGDGHDTAPGLLKLQLRSGGYQWEFVSIDAAFSDAGQANCWR